MNHIDTVKYIKNSLEQIKLIDNAPKGSDKIYIENLDSKTYPNMDIILFADMEHIDNPILQVIKPVLTGKINFDNIGCYIKLDKKLEFNIQFNDVFFIFVSFNTDLKDNELPSVADIMNMINSETDEYDGTKLISKGIPSMIDGDMKLRLTKIPYNINLKKTVTNDWNSLFYLKLDDENIFDKDFSIKLLNDNLGLNLEIHCLLNEKQQIVSAVKNYSKEKYLDKIEFCFTKKQYSKQNKSNNFSNYISIEMRIKEIIEEEITIEICKQNFQDILIDIDNDELLLKKEFIKFFNGLNVLNFNKTINFYSSEYKRENLIVGDLFRLAKNLEENISIKNITNNGVYFCSNNYDKNKPLDIPQSINGLWYLDVKNIGNTIIQTIYDLSKIENVFQRKSIGVSLEYSEWLNIYYLEHKHKTSDIEETEEKMFVDKKSINNWNESNKKVKYVNILEPVDNVLNLPKSTEEFIIEDYSLCYVRFLKTYLVFDGTKWNNIDDVILDYSDNIDLNNYKSKATIIFKKQDMVVLKSLLSLKYDSSYAIISIVGNEEYCYQQIHITDIDGKIHEYIRTFVKISENENVWSTREITFEGHKHKVSDIEENEDKFFMTKEIKTEIENIKKSGIDSVNTFLDLPRKNDVEDNVLYSVDDTKIIYSFDKINNIWIPISINSLSNIDEELEDDSKDVKSGLISKSFYQKLKDLFNVKDIKTSKNNSIFYGIQSNTIGSNSIDLVLREKEFIDKLGNNSVAIGNNIYKYNNKSVLIGNNLESILEKSVLVGNDLISNKSLFVFGNYNIDGDFAFCFGNGNDYDKSNIKRSNLFTVDYNGIFETSEKGGYAIKNAPIENVLLANGKTISIYDIYKIVRKLINSEPENLNIEKEMVENSEGILKEKIKLESISDSIASEIFNKLMEKRNIEIVNKTFSSF